MAESVVFVLIVGTLLIVALYFTGFQNIDPRLLVGFLGLLIAPGIYAAFTSGPFVPSSRKRHDTMMELADLKSTDVAYDLGCGDGRLVFRVAKKAKKAIGYELSVPLYLFGKIRQWFNPKSSIRYGNIWRQNYKDADVIFCYLLPRAMNQFYCDVWPHLKPGTRVISNAFQIHDVKPEKQRDKVYLYVAK